LTGVLVARNNGWPLIVVGGRRALHSEGIGYFQEMDAVPIYQSVTKWAMKVERTSDITSTLMRACEIACSGRPGPVYLDFPEDVLHGKAAPDPTAAPNFPPRSEANTEEVEQCWRLIMAGKRPLLILGEGIRWSFSPTALRNLVEQASIPFITSPMARGFLPDDHPLCANQVRRWIQSQADVVLMAGACFDWRFRFGGELSPGARVIHVDIDPSVLGKNLTGALTIQADSGNFLTQLQGAMEVEARPQSNERMESWLQHVRAASEETRRQRSAWMTKESKPMAPQQVFAELRRFLPKDAVVVLDGNVTLATGQAVLSAQEPCAWLDPGWSGCMGAGIPTGMGARLAAPDRMVVVVCGDFAFGLSAMDLETAVRQRIPIIVVIMNNNGLGGRVRQKTQFPADYPELFSRFQPGLRYERIAGVFGGHMEYVEEPFEIRPALERAAASGIAACINVSVDPDAPHPGPW
jgi:2-hydroxyacyl-CoA lyase 1